MDPQDVVVDDALDEVEEPPPRQDPAPEHTGGPGPAVVVRDPRVEDPQPGQDAEPGEGVEQAVPQRVHLQPVHRGGRVVADGDVGRRRAGQHVVPLQHLVQEDPVDEAAEAHTEEDAGQGDAPRLRRSGRERVAGRCHATTLGR